MVIRPVARVGCGAEVAWLKLSNYPEIFMAPRMVDFVDVLNLRLGASGGELGLNAFLTEAFIHQVRREGDMVKPVALHLRPGREPMPGQVIIDLKEPGCLDPLDWQSGSGGAFQLVSMNAAICESAGLIPGMKILVGHGRNEESGRSTIRCIAIHEEQPCLEPCESEPSGLRVNYNRAS